MKLTSPTKVLLALHLLLAIYSVNNVMSKLAAQTAFMSWEFIGCYGAVLLILGIYAIGWQQVIKRMPLTTAYANKAVTVVWGIVFGMIFFGETVTPLMLLGALVIIAGIVLYAFEEGRVQNEELKRMKGSLAGRDVYAPDGDGPARGASEKDGEAR